MKHTMILDVGTVVDRRHIGYVLPPGVCRAEAEHAAVARIPVRVHEDIDDQYRAIKVALARTGWQPTDVGACHGTVIVWVVERRPILTTIGGER